MPSSVPRPPTRTRRHADRSAQERVLVRLREMVLKGLFAPGERLTEIGMAAQLGVSRTPVKLALTSLAQEGLVEQMPSGGYAMRQFSKREICDAITVRGTLEGLAARLVAELRPSRGLLADLTTCLRQGDELLAHAELAYADYIAYTTMNDAFHLLLVHAAESEALLRAWELNNRLPGASPSATITMHESPAASGRVLFYSHRQHHALVDAIEAGQSGRAFALAEEHVEVARIHIDRGLQDPSAWNPPLPRHAAVTGAPLHEGASHDMGRHVGERARSRIFDAQAAQGTHNGTDQPRKLALGEADQEALSDSGTPPQSASRKRAQP